MEFGTNLRRETDEKASNNGSSGVVCLPSFVTPSRWARVNRVGDGIWDTVAMGYPERIGIDKWT